MNVLVERVRRGLLYYLAKVKQLQEKMHVCVPKEGDCVVGDGKHSQHGTRISHCVSGHLIYMVS